MATKQELMSIIKTRDLQIVELQKSIYRQEVIAKDSMGRLIEQIIENRKLGSELDRMDILLEKKDGEISRLNSEWRYLLWIKKLLG